MDYIALSRMVIPIDELGRIRKEVVVVCFKEVPRFTTRD
jgi:hypothetical protein